MMRVGPPASMLSMAPIMSMSLILSLGVGSVLEGSRHDSETDCMVAPEFTGSNGTLEEDMTAMMQVAAMVPMRKNQSTSQSQLSVALAANAAINAMEVPGAVSTPKENKSPAMLLATRIVFLGAERQLALGSLVLLVGLVPVIFKIFFPNSDAVTAICCGVFYIFISASMIETNKWLMMSNHFPYPLALTMNHMSVSFISCSILYRVYPSAFPAMEKLDVDWSFCRKFIPIGATFALSIVCGNAAYGFVSVPFLQIMKQSNIVTIYIFSTMVGLESVKRCNVLILAAVLTGSWMGVTGEVHFQLIGFILQGVSCLSEATKVIIQSILMSGTAKLDPLSMVLFMAPSCLLANTLPFVVFEGVKFREIFVHASGVWPILILNAMMAFALNLSVATCIKKLSPVGYLLCGITKDVCIIVSSAYLLGDSLSPMQIFGFCLALSGVFSYSMYKMHLDCFQDDALFSGTKRVLVKLQGKPILEKIQPPT